MKICLMGLFLVNLSAQVAELPPTMDWQGKSESLIVDDGHPWVTPAEEMDFERTPSYEESIAWLKKLSDASPLVSMTHIGLSLEGRPIWVVMVGAFSDLESLSNHKRPLLFVHAGIHSGEIDGKDAGLMFLRDLAFDPEKRKLTEKADFVFIPMLNPDGHERASEFNRVNQRGPKNMGWRTNARNQNLNRDFAKLDTPEVRALVQLMHQIKPDLYLDLHVTDGVDTQYDITYGFSGSVAYSPHIATWMEKELRPVVDGDLKAHGHKPFNFFFSMDNANPKKGIVDFMGSPRFSNVYGHAVHIPSILVENHSLKPYRQRVLGTYVLLESCLKLMGQKGEELRKEIEKDRMVRQDEVILTWNYPQSQPELIEYLGVAFEMKKSQTLGTEYVSWLGKAETWQIPFVKQNEPGLTAKLPKAYWVPAAWQDVIERVKAHHIQFSVVNQPTEIKVEQGRVVEWEFVKAPYEGRFTVKGKVEPYHKKVTYAQGSIRIPTDQDLQRFIALLFETDSPDSFFQWGFFNDIFQRTEYIEGYVLAPLVEKMMQNPETRTAFEKAMANGEIEDDPRSKMQWFYQRSDYYDQAYLIYPVGKEW